tara:strand:+ start:257 stop:973 length:717 start_codon:yes stop_codon:yes gene_type:complete
MSRPSATVVIMADDRWHDRLHYIHAAARINRNYADRHGYRFKAFALDAAACKGTLPSPCKLRAVQQVLLGEPSTETVVFADSDAVFLDQSVSVGSFLHTHGVNLTTLLVLPTDCDHFVLNAGLQIWRKGGATTRLLAEWIARARNYTEFPWEQEAMKRWYRAQHAWLRSRRLLQLIPYGEASWHVGSCDGSQYRPARWLSHITGRWPHARFPLMNATLARLGMDPWGTPCDCAVGLKS